MLVAPLTHTARRDRFSLSVGGFVTAGIPTSVRTCSRSRQKSPSTVVCLSAERLSGTEQFGEKHQEVGGGLWSRLKGKSASQSSVCTDQTSTNTHVSLDFTDTTHLIRGKKPNCFGSSPILHTFSMILSTIFNFGTQYSFR